MKTNYTENLEMGQLTAERTFEAPRNTVWRYFTTAELLDKWWGPLPYKAVTDSFDFSEGGYWRYVMQGPNGEAHYCVDTYKTIDAERSFTFIDAFANEDWSINAEMPSQEWNVTFTENGDVTEVKIVLTSKNREDLEKIVKMGMKEGFNQGLDQLESLLKG